MSNEKKVENISIDSLDDVTGGTGAPAKQSSASSFISKEITCPACGLVNYIREDINTDTCMVCGAKLV